MPATSLRAGPTETSFVEFVFPHHANHYGTLFGGNALKLLGKAAFVAATRYARCAVVMGRTERTEFHAPVRVGEMLDIKAHVTRIGRTSLTVAVEAFAEDIASGTQRPALSSRFEMVAVDAGGRPTPIPARSSITTPEDTHS